MLKRLMSRPNLILLAAGGSAAMMIGALLFQYVGDMAPCKLCYWQRYPHVAAIGIGVIALMVPGRLFPLLGALAALTTAGIGVYHTGIERAWWPGPESCTGSGGGLGGLSGTDLLSTAAPTGLVLCDEVAWEMFGLSMASWNAAASFGFACLWLMAARSRV
ncbi:disulfide bond formation protein B [Marimonas arenosa]|uniref:Disulfide bond formation protein B n=1 Tax=Marimonas arenosa TaxID=1795305 RepID=A0AAE3W9G5_9RHOB|nr:disulfide bond formation protein B [Marimonas arenosa]MDQ2088826.1 disulfide bond formation protein B [Marimonas arenosa]